MAKELGNPAWRKLILFHVGEGKRVMKWKIGAVLMTCVFCLAILPPLITGAKAGGGNPLDGIGSLIGGGGGSSSDALVLQEGNDRGMLKDIALALGGEVYRSEQGDIMAPATGIAEAFEMELNASSTDVTLTSGKKQVGIPVGGTEITCGEDFALTASPAVSTDDGIVFIPVEAVAEALGWGYAETDNCAVLTSKKEVKEKDLQKLQQQSLQVLGQPRAELLKTTLVFRAGSDCVVQNGTQVDLTDGEKFYAPVVENGKYGLPAKAVANAFMGLASDLEDGGVSMTIGENTIQLLNDGDIKLNDKSYRDAEDGDTFVKDNVTYISANLLCDMLGYSNAGEGDICLVGSLSFAEADSQVAYLSALGAELPDQRLDIPQADAYVALTFDDGPTGGSSGMTARLLDALKERDVHATFFMCGYRLTDFHTHTDRYLSEGHQLGNHTKDHLDSIWRKDAETISNQVLANMEIVKSYCGEEPTVFRPVGGNINEKVTAAAVAAGLPIINWSVDTEDWKYRDAEHIKNVIVNEAKDGDIVLMHDLRDCTLEGTIAAVDILKERGYAFVTVSELARIKGVTLEPGKEYKNFRDSTVAKMKGETTD